MPEVNDQVKIMETGEIGYVEEVSDGGERLKVRIPSSGSWPYPHHVYLDREKVRRASKKRLEAICKEKK
jgi:hypothetical protein